MTGGRGYFDALAEEARAARNGREVEGLRRLRHAITAARLETIPRNLDAFAEHLGVETIRRVPLAMHGRLVFDASRLVVELNQDDSPFLQRLTLAHELAHLILEANRVRTAVARGNAGATRSNAEYAELERVCDLLAAEIVLPERWLLEQLDLDVPSLAAAQSAASASTTPLTFVVRRAIERGLWRASAVGWVVVDDYAAAVWSVPDHGELFLAENRAPLAQAGLVARAMTRAGVASGSFTLRVAGGHDVVQAEALADEDETVVLLVPRE